MAKLPSLVISAVFLAAFFGLPTEGVDSRVDSAGKTPEGSQHEAWWMMLLDHIPGISAHRVIYPSPNTSGDNELQESAFGENDDKSTTDKKTTAAKTTVHTTTPEKTTTKTDKTTAHKTTEKTTAHKTTETTTAHKTEKTTHHITTTSEKPVGGSILDVLKNLEQTDFFSLVNGSGLAQKFDDPGNFTVFAPTNEAMREFFQELPHGSDIPEAFAKSLVLNHAIVTSVLNSTELVASKEPLVAGSSGSLFVNVVGNMTAVLINGKPLVLTSLDHVAENGIVHVISGVIYPIADQDALAEINQDPCMSILPFFVNPDEKICDALKSEERLFTAFLPINEAWSTLPYDDVIRLASNRTLLEDVVFHHVFPADAASSNRPVFRGALTNGTTLTPLSGKNVTVTVQESSGGATVVMVNNAKVVRADVTVKNGVLHMVDKFIN